MQTNLKSPPFFNELIQAYKQAQVKIAALLQGPDVAVAYSRHFLNKTLEERLTFYDSFDALIKATDYAFADGMFFDKLVEILATEPCVCYLMGDEHTHNTTQLLQAYGCDILQSETVERHSFPLFSTHNIVEYQDSVSGKKQDKLPCDLIYKALPIFLESVMALPNTCWTCATMPEKLLSCSRCKKALYCNSDCQRERWESHKKFCVKASQGK